MQVMQPDGLSEWEFLYIPHNKAGLFVVCANLALSGFDFSVVQMKQAYFTSMQYSWLLQ